MQNELAKKAGMHIQVQQNPNPHNIKDIMDNFERMNQKNIQLQGSSKMLTELEVVPDVLNMSKKR